MQWWQKIHVAVKQHAQLNTTIQSVLHLSFLKKKKLYINSAELVLRKKA